MTLAGAAVEGDEGWRRCGLVTLVELVMTDKMVVTVTGVTEVLLMMFLGVESLETIFFYPLPTVY